jgi:hypothetical protein
VYGEIPEKVLSSTSCVDVADLFLFLCEVLLVVLTVIEQQCDDSSNDFTSSVQIIFGFKLCPLKP